MVIVHKTLGRARSMVHKMAAAGMIAFGFALLLIMPSSKHHNPFSEAMGGDGVAHADAVSCSCSTECTDCGSFEATSGGVGS